MRRHKATCRVQVFLFAVPRQIAFAQERGWHALDFVQTVGDDYVPDIGVIEKRRLLVFLTTSDISSGLPAYPWPRQEQKFPGWTQLAPK